MPYQDAPDNNQIKSTVAIECKDPGWVRCPDCGYRFFYVEEVSHIVFVPYCPKCKTYFRFMIGMTIELT